MLKSLPFSGCPRTSPLKVTSELREERVGVPGGTLASDVHGTAQLLSFLNLLLVMLVLVLVLVLVVVVVVVVVVVDIIKRNTRERKRRDRHA
jgi:uncharacterized membrane protein